ncbi:MAG TPA: HPF/RaiA family ribosome-associated protein [Steroidobacteraceae bacterium]|nr:HPF/RaiA family ribosome-associated protein [Steroidobacteraceae bacterium]
MQTPVMITFRHVSTSAAAEENIRGHIAYLEQHFGNLTSCRVIVDAPPAHRNKGAAFSVHVDLSVPGRDIFASVDGDESGQYSDVYVAIRDAFEAVKRQLENHSQKRRGEVKTH